jgi:hypothetical protein
VVTLVENGTKNNSNTKIIRNRLDIYSYIGEIFAGSVTYYSIKAMKELQYVLINEYAKILEKMGKENIQYIQQPYSFDPLLILPMIIITDAHLRLIGTGIPELCFYLLKKYGIKIKDNISNAIYKFKEKFS